MKKVDFLALDGRLIRLFLTVYECLSITRAAELLDTTQSNVSHNLDRLRLILNDPLFIRAGRGMSATEGADKLAPAMRQLLSDMSQLVEPETYQPEQDNDWFTIAGNDFEIETLIKPFYQILKQAAPNVRLRILQLGSTTKVTELLRQGNVDLAVAPSVSSNADDLRQQLLFQETMSCFYDASIIEAPTTMKRYLNSPHVMIGFGSNKQSNVDLLLESKKMKRKVGAEVASFYIIPDMIRNSPMIATLSSKLADSILKELDSCCCPLTMPPMNFYQYWHERNNNSLRHQWFRQQLYNLGKG